MVLIHNPFFTLDFAEAQLEWTTPPKNSFKSALKVLKESQRWTMTHPSKEAVAAFWPYSMPMKLDKALPWQTLVNLLKQQRKNFTEKGYAIAMAIQYKVFVEFTSTYLF